MHGQSCACIYSWCTHTQAQEQIDKSHICSKNVVCIVYVHIYSYTTVKEWLIYRSLEDHDFIQTILNDVTVPRHTLLRGDPCHIRHVCGAESCSSALMSLLLHSYCRVVKEKTSTPPPLSPQTALNHTALPIPTLSDLGWATTRE